MSEVEDLAVVLPCRERVLDGVQDVLIGDPVPPGGAEYPQPNTESRNFAPAIARSHGRVAGLEPSFGRA